MDNLIEKVRFALQDALEYAKGNHTGRRLERVVVITQCEQALITLAALEAKPAGTVTLPASTKVCNEICQLAAASRGVEAKPTDAEPLLPCDFKIGHATFKKGVAVRLAEGCANRYYDAAMKNAAAVPDKGICLRSAFEQINAGLDDCIAHLKGEPERAILADAPDKDRAEALAAYNALPWGKPEFVFHLAGFLHEHEETIRAALRAPAAVPDGWQLVPKDATYAMQCAAIDVDSYKLGDISPLGFRCSPQKLFAKCWTAMLAAAPTPAKSKAHGTSGSFKEG